MESLLYYAPTIPTRCLEISHPTVQTKIGSSVGRILGWVRGYAGREVIRGYFHRLGYEQDFALFAHNVSAKPSVQIGSVDVAFVLVVGLIISTQGRQRGAKFDRVENMLGLKLNTLAYIRQCCLMSAHARVRLPAGKMELGIVRLKAYGRVMIHQSIIESAEFPQCSSAQ